MKRNTGFPGEEADELPLSTILINVVLWSAIGVALAIVFAGPL